MNHRLREIRKALDLKQYAFAEKLGITQTFLSELERGNRNISSTILFALDEIGINLHWFITGEGEMFRTAEIENSASAAADLLSQLQKLLPELQKQLKK